MDVLGTCGLLRKKLSRKLFNVCEPISLFVEFLFYLCVCLCSKPAGLDTGSSLLKNTIFFLYMSSTTRRVD